MATYYWVGGTGTWNSTNTANWSLSSNGPGGAGYPTPLDDVIIDSSSGTGTVTLTSSSVSQCRNLTSTASQAIALSGGLSLFGNLFLPAGGSSAYFNLNPICVGSGNKTITTNGKGLNPMDFNSASGTWTLQDALSVTFLSLTAGTLNTNGQTVTCTSFTTTGTIPRTLNLGSSTVTTSTWTISSTTAFTLNAGTSTISSGFTTTFTGAGLTYNNLTITATQSGVAHTITGANTFNNLSIAAPATDTLIPVTLGANQTVTGTLTATGTSTRQRIFFRSDIVGVSRTITAAAWSASPANLDFRDIVIAGAVGTLSGTAFGNCGGNSGITFPAAKTVYWNLTGSQNWSAIAWAPSSGGTPALSNFPLAQDIAVIDNTGSAGTITISDTWNVGTFDASARTTAVTLTMSATASNPVFYGDVTLGTGLTINNNASNSWWFVKQGTQTLNTNGINLGVAITVNSGTGILRFLGNVTTTATNASALTSGTLDLNNFGLTHSASSSSFTISANTLSRTIAFGSTGSITIAATSGPTIWSAGTLTGFTLTGTPTVNFTGAPTSGTRSILHGSTSGGTEANAITVNVSGGSSTASTDIQGHFRNITLTGYAAAINNATRTIYGNWLISTGTTLNTGTSGTTFAGTNATQDLTTNGKTLDFPITIGGTGTNTTLRLQDALTQGASRAFTITAGSTFNANSFSASVGTLTFSATPTIANLVGGTLTCQSVSHNGGNLIMSASLRLTVTGAYLLNQGVGTLDFGNQSVSFGSFSASSSGARTINLGSGTITITGSGTAWSMTGTGYTFNAGTSTISMTGGGSKSFAGGSYTYYNLQQAGVNSFLTITGVNTFNTISNTVQPCTIIFGSGTTHTVGSLNLNGTSGNLVTLAAGSAGSAYTMAYAGNTVNTMNFVSVSDFTGATAGIFFATNSTNGGNNTNLTFGAADTSPRYWVGGGSASWTNTATANWATSSGGTGGASAPTIETDVFFDAGSNVGTSAFSVTLTGTGTAGLVCRDLTISGLDGTLTWTVSASAILNIWGSLTLPATNFTRSGTPTINFRSTSTGQTITSNGQILTTNSNVTFDGVGGGWTLADALNIGTSSTSILNVTRGSFNTAGFAVTAGGISSTNSNVRSINLGASTVTLSGTTPWNTTTNTNLTFVSGTSQITFTNTSSVTLDAGSGLIFNNVSSTGSSTSFFMNILGNNTFNNLTLAPTSGSGSMLYSFNNNQTITGTLTCSGASPILRVQLQSNTLGTQRTLTVNNFATPTDIDFQDIQVTGAAAPVSGTRLGNCGGVGSGVVTSTPKTVYWNLAAGGEFGATAWALQEGGSVNINNFPLPQDTAVITNTGLGSGNAISMTWIRAYPTIDTSGRTVAMTLNNVSNNLSFYGNFLVGTGVSLSASGTGYFFRGRGNHTIQSNGKTFGGGVIMDSATGTYTLSDALTVVSASSFNVTSGNFNSANLTITAGFFTSNNSNTRSITLGTSTINLTSTGTVVNFAAVTGLTLSAASSTINLTNTSISARTVDCGGLFWGTLNIGGTTGTSTTTLSGTGTTWNNITTTKTVAHTIQVASNTTINFNNFSVSGNPGALVTLTGSNSASIFNYSGSGVVSVDYVSVSGQLTRFTPAPNTLGTTPYRWYLGANSTNTAILASATMGPAFISGTQRAYLLSSVGFGSWAVPTDWDSNNNAVYLIGAGGPGGTASVSGNNRAAGGGGGGGGFTALVNVPLTPGSTVSYQVPNVGTSVKGGDSWFSSNIYWAGGGQGGSSAVTPTSAGGAGGTGLTANGGAGGAGSFGTTASAGYGSGGGGGAGGPGGVGGAGGAGYGGDTVSANIAGGGGGGNGGGSAGGNASQAVRGVGGNNAAGAGGSGTGDGSAGGGGAGGVSTTNPGSGGVGLDVLKTFGGGGGHGGAGVQNTGGILVGAFGGGGTGGAVTTAGALVTSGSGSQGAIFIVYTPSAQFIRLDNVRLEGGVRIG